MEYLSIMNEMDDKELKMAKKVESGVNGQQGITVKVKVTGFMDGGAKRMSIHVGSEVEALAVAYYYRHSKRSNIMKAGGQANTWIVVVGN